MTRIARLGTALAAVALAACVDTQAPDSPSAPTTTDNSSLPAAAKGGSNGFTITLRFINPPTATQEGFFRTAAAKWQSVIVEDVPNTASAIPPRSCGSSFDTPAFSGGVDDVLIDVLLQPIDGPGAVLGAAGPCLVRSSDFLTVYGIMFFDTADLDLLEDFGIFDEVVVHEMGHVLGVGTLWDFRRDLLQGTAADPRFVGPNAIAGYHEVGGRGVSVPVEEGFGPGTRFSHWDEETFRNELMTGFISLHGKSPLSIMTVGSMQDLGYGVSAAGADKYQIGSNQERTAEDVTDSELFDLGSREQLIRPTGVID